MRQKLNETDKRGSQIGIKVKKETKEKILFISEREARPMSTQINMILESFVEDYFKKHGIDWEKYAPQALNEE